MSRSFAPSGAQLKKQAEALRKKILAAQNEVALQTFESRSGTVSASVTGRGEVVSIDLGPLEGQDASILAEQVASAVNSALRAARSAMDKAAEGAGRLSL